VLKGFQVLVEGIRKITEKVVQVAPLLMEIGALGCPKDFQLIGGKSSAVIEVIHRLVEGLGGPGKPGERGVEISFPFQRIENYSRGAFEDRFGKTMEASTSFLKLRNVGLERIG
jgi:hypothetical protein